MEFDYSRVPELRRAGMGMQEAKRYVEKQYIMDLLYNGPSTEELCEVLLYLVRRL